jgi:ABC-type proline/glycine betaine transport system permease subunit
MGRALLPGVSIVFVAIILDRLTQGSISQKSAFQLRRVDSPETLSAVKGRDAP